MARRLEAWCINHGLSQLQVIFNELKGKKKKGASVGTGLKKSLSEFISYPLEESLAVLFTISPSQDNAKSTEATLRFAESAALVQSIPVKPKKKINKDLLIAELRKDIAALEGIISVKDSKIQTLEQQLIEQQLLDNNKSDESNMNTPININSFVLYLIKNKKLKTISRVISTKQKKLL